MTPKLPGRPDYSSKSQHHNAKGQTTEIFPRETEAPFFSFTPWRVFSSESALYLSTTILFPPISHVYMPLVLRIAMHLLFGSLAATRAFLSRRVIPLDIWGVTRFSMIG